MPSWRLRLAEFSVRREQRKVMAATLEMGRGRFQ